ncbi:TPA: hypothetical protein HA265_05500 [Candidatus Woesearchaeota archaeon]|nr:hypothetical protein [Candidatus Woesearchaeota archaeon]
MGLFDFWKKKKRYVAKLTVSAGKRQYHLGDDESGHWVIFFEDKHGDHEVVFRSKKTGYEGHDEAVTKLHHYSMNKGAVAAAKTHHYRHNSPHKQAHMANRSMFGRR